MKKLILKNLITKSDQIVIKEGVFYVKTIIGERELFLELSPRLIVEKIDDEYLYTQHNNMLDMLEKKDVNIDVSEKKHNVFIFKYSSELVEYIKNISVRKFYELINHTHIQQEKKVLGVKLTVVLQGENGFYAY